MNKIILTAAAAAMLCGVAEAKSFKRGVSENQFAIGAQMQALEPGVSWYYNWANKPSKGYQSEVENFEGFDFVPMCWSGAYDADAIRQYVQSHPRCKYLLGFNEPNFTAQANLTPQRAAELWPAVKALAAELNLELVAPALNYSPDAPYQDPLKWMDEFVTLVGADAFDHVAVHNYGGAEGMKVLCTNFHERYGKPVWVTEFCLWPGGAGAVSVQPEVQIASMVESLDWLERTPWIHRYAWFKAIGAHETSAANPNPCYGLIINKNGLGERELSPQGKVYVHMTAHEPDRWHAPGQTVAATDYSRRELASIAPGTAADAPKPIEISAFSGGAVLEYQFDVPAAGDYTLTLTVSGQGEPVRFDPCIKLLDVTDGAETLLLDATRFTLSGSDTDYRQQSFDITLPAGHRTLRIADGAQYQPSGLRISHLMLEGRNASAVSIDADTVPAVYYNLQGLPVDHPTPGSVYIRVANGHAAKVVY